MELQLRDYQNAALDMLRDGFRDGHKAQILYLATGGGKCLGRDTPVIMADGTVKMVQDVVAGDRLLGPDSKPRIVRSVINGIDNLYKVIPVKGDSYVVNESHILSLKTTGTRSFLLHDGTKVFPGETVNINIKDYLQCSNTAKNSLKGWRSDAVTFERQFETLPVDPYWLGLWLGDGRSSDVSITKPNCNAVRWWIVHAEAHGHEVSKYEYKGKCPEWRVKNKYGTNKFLETLKRLNVLNNKHIPDLYKYAPVQERLRLIAGLMDTDGSVTKTSYDWISKDKRMAEDVAFICRSVGLAAYITECTKGIKSTGFAGTYYRLSISGPTNIVHCLDKIAPKRLQKKRHNVTGIKVEPIGKGQYYGFELDGDKLFLLGDFTVTHNTECAIALLEAARNKGTKAAMLLDRIVLCDQTSQRLDKYSIDHGVMQSGHWRYRPSEPIQVCSAQTIEKRGSFPGITLLIVDEAHNSRLSTNEFIKNNPNIKVIGLTATPFTKGLGSIYSNVVCPITTKKLVDAGSLVPLRVFVAKEINMEGAKKVAGEWSQAEATARGKVITGDIVSEWIKKTHEIFGKPEKTIVFCAGVEHGIDLQAKFQEQGYNFISISYKDDDDFKRQVIEDFNKTDSDIVGLIATDLLTKGFDSPAVKIGVSARPFTKSLSSHIQQMGRVMRPYPGKDFALWLDHSGNFLRFRDDWEEVFENGVKELDDGKEKAKKEPTEKEKQDSKCPACGALWPRGSDTCTHCGHVRQKKNMVLSIPGMMEELGSMSRDERQAWWNMIQYKIMFDGWSRGRGAHTYREKFGVWPRGVIDGMPVPPNTAFEKHVRAGLIRYLKGRR